VIHLDTHIVAWLYDARLELFSEATLDIMRNEPLAVSPMAGLELQYLHEIGRLADPASAVLDNLRTTIGLQISEASFADVVAHAKHLNWTRDPFDRIIVAQAVVDQSRLVTRDRKILSHCPSAIW